MGNYEPDLTSTEWSRFKAWLELELKTQYEKLASLDISDRDTWQLRGQIAFIKRLLSNDKGRYAARLEQGYNEREMNNNDN